MNGLGRRVPTDWRHVERYRLSTLIADPSHELQIPPPKTELSLGLPSYAGAWDQGEEGACVGFGTAAMMGVTNTRQWALTHPRASTFRYEPWSLYRQAQLIDEWGDTPPEEGTSVRAGCDVLRTQGPRRVLRGVVSGPFPAQGISANRWATTVDEMRAALYAQSAVAIGVGWYEGFDRPYVQNGERWLPEDGLGQIRSGHCACVYRMSDRRRAFRFMNSWGLGYPPVWIPYVLMQRLLDEDGEAAVITDR